ncbi:methionyl-tRNA formyltransferase [Enterovirga sp.]|uniref:methionyl-tRNA formyltransferase n=1 Tax=Enterovirga sp. TaxID=2026350 RepID=UPI002CA06196|nr:methionyl-tRNA formyltransferase [Enterovirga sp.]HMO30126.1 methionyl-tRNA formyltransferase [Enterovirga sp.]
MTLRVVFMGTPGFAVPVFEAVAGAGHEIAAAYTRAPAAAGRGMKPRPSPVQKAAEARGVRVLSPANFRLPEDRETFAALGADVAVVVAYGLLLPKPILEAPRLGCLNVHASLLPRWRGAAPIHRAVMAGDRETGVAVMRMEEGLDTGPVGLEARVPIGPDATTGELHDILAAEGARLMAEALARLEAGTLAFVPQREEGVTYARKIANEEARIDWSLPARRVHDLVRGLSPFPGAYAELDLGRGPERVKILRGEPAAGAGRPGSLIGDGLIACGEGAYRPLLLQRAGKAPVAAAEFWRGARV